MDRVKNTRDKLNLVGPGFCPMKWLNETLYLQTGDNHSCYHPRPHHIPLEEVTKDVSALHNTNHKKLVRKEMLDGKRPDECYYCWNVEDLDGEHFSDRMFHSSSNWVDNSDIDLITTSSWDKNINPRYLELSFGNGCNFKCGYCCPQASSLWVDEIKKFGNYDISYNQYGIEFLNNNFYNDNDYNPYVDAFWKWWPSLSKDLKVLRITGGEPLTNKNTYKMFDMLDFDPAPELEINMNSNLGVTNAKINRLSKKIKKLLDEKKIKSFRLYTSIDSWGTQAEYIRQGLDCSLWQQNFNTFIKNTNSPINIMVTYNILAVGYFTSLLQKILELRKVYNSVDNQTQMVGFDTPYLKEPPHWMINLLPIEEFGHYLDSDLEFIKSNMRNDYNDTFQFSEHEYEKFKRVRNYFYQGSKKITDDLILRGRKDFYKFFSEYDKRNNINFFETFPKYYNFMLMCKDLCNES